MKTDKEKILSVCELALHLGRSSQYVYRLAKLGAPIYNGRGYLSEVIEWLKHNKVHPFAKR